MSVDLPLTGAGGTTATVATELIGGAHYQQIKVYDAAAASTLGFSGASAVPSSGAFGLTVRAIPTTAQLQGVAVSSGAILGAGSSANVIGAVAQGPGSSDNFWFNQSIPFSSGQTSRTSISTTVDTQIVAANAARKALIVANRSTLQTVGIGFSTAVLTTALANVDVFIGPSSFISFGLHGGLPLYTGPLRGLNLTSTAVAGSVAVTQFT